MKSTYNTKRIFNYTFLFRFIGGGRFPSSSQFVQISPALLPVHPFDNAHWKAIVFIPKKNLAQQAVIAFGID